MIVDGLILNAEKKSPMNIFTDEKDNFMIFIFVYSIDVCEI